MKYPVLILSFLTSLTLLGDEPYPGNDADHSVSRPVGFLDAYTGNTSFETLDLTEPGAIGDIGLSWSRRANSRATRLQSHFGLGHNWSHNWQWELVQAGPDRSGRRVLSLRRPDGIVQRFTQVSDGGWWPEASGRERLAIVGDDVIVSLLKGRTVRFAQVGSSRGEAYQLAALSDGFGNEWGFDWDDGRLVKISEPAGRWVRIHYKTLTPDNPDLSALHYDVIQSVTTSNGQSVHYQYVFPHACDYPVLTGAIYPGGIEANYRYEEPMPGRRQLLVQVEDPKADAAMRNRTFHYREDAGSAHGQLASVRDSTDGAIVQELVSDQDMRGYGIATDDGAGTYHAYGPGGNLLQTVDALGHATSIEYDANGRGYKTAETDPFGHTTHYHRDIDGHVIGEQYADGSRRSWSHDGAGRKTSETDELGNSRFYERDRHGRVIAVIHPDGRREETLYNDWGQPIAQTRAGVTTRFEYNDAGLRSAMIDPEGARTLFAYDDLGQLSAVTDARGNQTRYEYDSAGNLVRIIHADGSFAEMFYDPWGQMIRHKDETGVTTAFEYDAFGRLLASTDGAGNKTLFEYPGITHAARHLPVRRISPGGTVATMKYDDNGRLLAETIAAETKEAATTRYSYDRAGRLISVTDPLGNTTSRRYDKRGRLVQVVSALGNLQFFSYDAVGRRISETDPNNHTKHWHYDRAGRVIAETDALGHVTRKMYNPAGLLSTLIDPRGNVYRFDYDSAGRQTGMVYPDGSRESSRYDAVGNKRSFTNRAGVVQHFTYDNRNRVLSSEWSDHSETVTMAYDAAGRTILQENEFSRITFSYDAAGRLAAETQDLTPRVTRDSFDPEPRTVHYRYDADARKASLHYPDGTEIGYRYSARGDLTAIIGDGWMPPIARYEYDTAGNTVRIPRENATETWRTFDEDYQLIRIFNDSPEGPLAEMKYVYDPARNRTSTQSITHGAFAMTSIVDTYEYDPTSQLTRVHVAGAPSGAENLQFRYDAVGNRIDVQQDGSVTRYAADSLNQYTQVGEFRATNDLNGNLAGLGIWLYRYDAMNRLIEASNGTVTSRFYYDAKNRCVARSYREATGAVRLQLNTYDDWNLIEERDGNDQQTARFVHGAQTDELVLIVNRHGAFYPHQDLIGNVTHLTDHAGNAVESYRYGAYGAVTIFDENGERRPQSTVENRFLFTGREYLPEIQLYDYRNRFYSASLGRFLQTDPIRFDAGDMNLYRYVSNNPLNLVDPTGLTQTTYNRVTYYESGANVASPPARVSNYSVPYGWGAPISGFIRTVVSAGTAGAVYASTAGPAGSVASAGTNAAASAGVGYVTGAAAASAFESFWDWAHGE